MPNPQDIFQLAQQTATQVTASPENWRRFLYTAAHNYHTTYLNQLLIHAQRPDATACATMKYWNEQAHRKVMYGSKSIIILQRHQGVPTAKRVFSMTDTVLTGDKAAAPWEVTDAIRPLLMQVNSVGSLMDRATEQVVSLSDRANRVLATSIEDSALNWSHPEDQRFILQEVAAQSTLYMVCIRLGIPVREEDFPAFRNVTQFDTSRISLCLGGYVQAAAEPLLDELGHEVMQLARDSVAIQAEPVHNTDTQSPTQTTSREEAVTDDVHERNRIPDSEPELAESQENQPEPVRQNAAGLLGAERAEPVRPDDAGGNAAAELQQDGTGRTAAGGQDAARLDAESADARPQDKPAGLGADVQQPEATGGGNDPSDAVRSITEEPAAAESEESPSAFSLPEFPAELLPSLLKADTTSRASNADILSFFSKTPLLIDRLRYIRESYKVVFTELLLEDDTRVGFYKESNGLLVWRGSYLTRSAESHLSWHSVTAAISALVDNHELIAAIDPKKAISQDEQLSFDLPENASRGDEVGALEVDDIYSEEEQDAKIKATLPAYHYKEPRPDDGSHITEDDVNVIITRGSVFEGGKYRIYNHFQQKKAENETVAFLKKEYGIGGFSWTFADGGSGFVSFDGKGLSILYDFKDDLHMAVAQTVVEGNIMAAAADSAFVIGKQTGNILKELKDETINAKDALKAGGKVLRLQGGKSVVKIGGATLRSTEQYLSSFQVSTDDFTGSVPGKVKEAATNTGNILKKITNVVLHPLRNLIAMGKVILMGAVILLFLIIVSLLGQMSGTTSTSVFGANRIEDIQTLVQKINDYRNAAVTEGIYQAFQNDVDPNGNPYGYDSLTGQRSNNLQHGVTWNYANGIYNDTAEIISLAAVYYQQDWPRSELLSAFSDNVPFTKFCRALAAYGLDVTARESAPYSCMSYGGCVNGYRSEGEMVSIKDYRLETHTCSEGDDACGQYDAAAEWHWNEGHAENRSYSIWKEDGTHDVTVFFPIIFPDGATGSALSDLPEEYNAVADGKIKAADCTGNIVLDESANLYKGELNDWFYTPDELTVTFTVVTGEGDDAVSDDYEVAFTNATAIPWCPGELNDGQYGHYDLSCTIYLTGYDRYTDPETQAPNGADGGTGNLEALAESCDAGTLTRTIIKQDQYGNEYAGNAVSARYTKTITLPNGASGFQGWYKDGEDTYGNVEWASLLYRMDWEELYGIVDGIKCRATGSGMTEEELRQLFASLNIDATTARGQVVAFALSCQGKFVYAQPSSLRGGPGSPSVGINLDCSSFVQYCYWAQNLPFSAGSTAAYRNAADLVSISTSEVQPGDLRVVYASGGEQGHVQMALGGDAWIECCYGYGVAVNMSNAWMESRPCYYFRYAGF